MTDTVEDVVARLRKAQAISNAEGEWFGTIFEEAAAEIERLRAERDELEAKWISADEGEKVNGEFLAHADARLDAAEHQKAQLVEALRPFAFKDMGWLHGSHIRISVLRDDIDRARTLIKEMEGNG